MPLTRSKFFGQNSFIIINNNTRRNRMPSIYHWESEVRDNEVDLQGVVNNANYFIYMAHARHKHLSSLGIDFQFFHTEGFDLLLIHTDMTFKDSLKSGDEFIVTSELKANGRIKFDFYQDVIRKSDNKVI